MSGVLPHPHLFISSQGSSSPKKGILLRSCWFRNFSCSLQANRNWFCSFVPDSAGSRVGSVLQSQWAFSFEFSLPHTFQRMLMLRFSQVTWNYDFSEGGCWFYLKGCHGSIIWGKLIYTNIVTSAVLYHIWMNNPDLIVLRNNWQIVGYAFYTTRTNSLAMTNTEPSGVGGVTLM